jgi:hypothetical protein
MAGQTPSTGTPTSCQDPGQVSGSVHTARSAPLGRYMVTVRSRLMPFFEPNGLRFPYPPSCPRTVVNSLGRPEAAIGR